MFSFLKLTEEMKNAEEAASSGAIEMPLDLVALELRAVQALVEALSAYDGDDVLAFRYLVGQAISRASDVSKFAKAVKLPPPTLYRWARGASTPSRFARIGATEAMKRILATGLDAIERDPSDFVAKIRERAAAANDRNRATIRLGPVDTNRRPVAEFRAAPLHIFPSVVDIRDIPQTSCSARGVRDRGISRAISFAR